MMRNEIRFAIRSLVRDRGFALMVILSLAVGIGANTAIFSLVNGVLLRPLPYPDSGRLIAATIYAPRFMQSYPALPVSIGFFEAWRKQLTSFESLGISQSAAFNLTGDGQPEQVRGAIVSGSIF